MSRTSELLKQKQKEREQTAPLTEQTDKIGGGTTPAGSSRTRNLIAEKMQSRALQGGEDRATAPAPVHTESAENTARTKAYYSPDFLQEARSTQGVSRGAAVRNSWYNRELERRYDDWRATVRTPELVYGALDKNSADIRALEDDLRLSRKNAAASPDDPDGMRAADEYAARLEEQLEALRKDRELLDEELGWARHFQQEELRRAPDWEEKSRYAGADSGDLQYGWINRDPAVYAALAANEDDSGASVFGMGREALHRMSDDEVSVFNYLYATQGRNRAYDYVSRLSGELNARQRQQTEAEAAELAQRDPVGASVLSVFTSGLRGLGYAAQAADYLTDGSIDQNAAYNFYSHQNSAVRAAVSEQIEKSGKWGSIGSFAYNTGMSMGDFLFNTAISGGNQALALAIMGTGAAADATISAKDRGLSDDQAFALGTVAGAAEVAMEKLSMDKLFDLKTLGESSLKYVLQNTLTEGGEEVGTELINTLADFIIAQDQSEWNASIAAYMAQGMSEDEAREQTLKDKALDFGLTGLGGMISGGIVSGGGVAVNAAGNYFQNSGAPGTDASTEAPATVESAAPGLSTDNMTNGDIAAELMSAGATEEAVQELAPLIERVLAGEEISGNQAGAIAKNEAAVSVLENATGEAINTDAPLGEVKTTIRGLASRQNAQVEPAAAEDTTTQAQPVETQETAPASPTMEAVTQNNVQAMADFAKTMEKAGAAAMTQMYDGSQSAEQYVAGMMRAYNAGKNGTSRAEIINDLQGITAPQAEAAYLAGQADAQNGGTAVARTAKPRYTNLNNKLEGATESDGEAEVYLRNGSQRAGSSYPGGQVSAVEGGAGQNTLRTIRGRPADGETARLSYGEKVSTASLGIGGGSTNANIRIVTGGDTAATAKARKAAKERGLRLVLFSGDNLRIRQADGSWASVRGYISGDRVFARADHPVYTSDQIMRHEVGHDMIRKGEVDPDTVRERIVDTFGKDKYDVLAKLYVDAYAGTGMTAEEIWEEVICDSLGDMNIFAGTLSEELAHELSSETKAAAQTTRKAPTRAPPVSAEGKASRETGRRAQRGRSIEVETMENNRFKRLRQFHGELPSEWYAFTRDNFYIYSNQSFTDYTILMTAKLTKRNRADIEAFMEELENGTIGSTETFNSWAQGFRRGKGRNSWHRVRAGNSGTAGRYDGVDVRAQGSEHSGNSAENGGAGEVNPKFSMETPVEQTEILSEQAKNTDNLMPTTDPDIHYSRELESLRDLSGEQSEIFRNAQEAVRTAVREELDRMGKEYGWIEPGERAYREAQVPKRTDENKKVSQTVRTILEARATPDTAVPNIEHLIAQGDFSYEQYSDKAALADAERTITHKGWNKAQREWFDDVRKGVVSKENTATGWVLYNNAANSGNIELAMDILTAMVEHQRSAAQALQATRILKKLSPDTQLYQVQRSVNSLQEELIERYGNKKGPDLKVDQELAERFMRAKDQSERDEVLKDIYRDIGRQMPSRFMDKWNAWRYLAMLGNPRTHVRNVVGNAGFAPVVAVKNLTATAIEEAVGRLSGGKLIRSKGAISLGKKDRALLSAAWGDYAKVQETLLPGGKYSDFANANRYIEEGRVIFKNRALETARKANSKALDAEDVWFAKPHYAAALAQYCKAHGITAEQVATGKGLKQARSYATREAQKATYRDMNALSSFLSRRFSDRGEYGKAGRAGNMVLDGILPFRKTPANILARGVEYSPIGLLNGIKQAAWDVQKGRKTGAEAIDSISAGLTGTGLLALGVFLAAQGLVRGHGGEDDKENTFEELMGHQAYALELPDGTSITLDWLAPECLPFFVGVNLWETTSGEDERVTLSKILTSAATVTEPMLEMSCLQSLNEVFDAVGYASENGLDGLPSALASAATSYLTQGFPTLLGQAERAGQNERMTTYTEKDAFLTSDMQYTLGQISSRIPGWDYQQIPYIDAWGRTENTGTAAERVFGNFLNPAYTSNIDTSKIEDELLRLYQVTGEGGVLPSRAARYFTVNGDRKDLTAEEYVIYATLKGRNSYELVGELTASQQYRALSDAEKVKAVKEAYDLANQTAKAAISDYETENWMQKAAEAEEKYGISPGTYISLKTRTTGIQSLKDANGETITNSKSLLIMQEVYNTPDLTDKQRQALFEYLGVGKTVRHYNKAAVKERLEKLRKLEG